MGVVTSSTAVMPGTWRTRSATLAPSWLQVRTTTLKLITFPLRPEEAAGDGTSPRAGRDGRLHIRRAGAGNGRLGPDRGQGANMENTRIDWLRKQVELNPNDPRLRFGLALEYEKLGRWSQVADELREYLALTDDQGNAWGRLAGALRALGREGEARDAYRRGIEAARRHGHPGMAAEFEEALEELDG